jgi:Mn-dependent DtxR family transcriptional regulator
MHNPPNPSHSWSFFSNYAHVLVTLAEDPSARLRDVAERVGITERAVQRIVAQLEQAGVLTKERDGRRNHYQIDTSCHLRHPLERHTTVGNLLHMVLDDKPPAD